MFIVTGATGFLGHFVVDSLLSSGYEFKCMVRKSSNTAALKKPGVSLTEGDLDQPETLKEAFYGCDTLINLASLGFGHAPGLIAAAETAGIRRAIFISTTAIFTTLPAESKRVRCAAEEIIINSKLDYTILRPTMIYGTGKDRNIARLIRYVNRFSLIPVFGKGVGLIQPVYVADLADAVVGVIRNGQVTGRKAYNLAGKDALSYAEALEIVGRLLGKKVRMIRLPVGMTISALKIAKVISGKEFFSTEQVLRLQEDKAFSYAEAEADFAYNPCRFEEGVSLEIAEMRQNGLL